MLRILTNHVSYSVNHAKYAIIQASSEFSVQSVSLVDEKSGNRTNLAPSTSRQVDSWSQGWFAEIDFSGTRQASHYRIEVLTSLGPSCSTSFTIDEAQSMEIMLADILYYFKGQRASGPWDKADSQARFFGARKGTADVHGGWYDASGDYSKYLSHLGYAHYMNPQQTPLVVYNFALARETLETKTSERIQGLIRKIDEEAAHGGDFLLRMLDPEGYFYITVFDRWSKDTKQRDICSYSTQAGIKSDKFQASWRQGGGMAIAALAKLGAQQNAWGEFSHTEYLTGAARAFAHLLENNLSYESDGKENILDDYCALLAACELYEASCLADDAQRLVCGLSPSQTYLDFARQRAQALASRVMLRNDYQGWLRADAEGARPFFHASDAGLPILSLNRYLELEPEEELHPAITKTLLTITAFELALAKECDNPFGLARQYTQALDKKANSSFFIPHTNESGYWWQGENARLASLSCAYTLAAHAVWLKKAPSLPEAQAGKIKAQANSEALQTLATRQLDWILGLNPFDTCMLHGRGRNNPEYVPLYPNAPGGVCNGITSGFEDEHDIAFRPDNYKNDPMQNWRWGEQWIPHAAWLFLAISLRSD